MDLEPQRAEEREVLSSIYSGDSHFHAIDDRCFQYRVEPDENPRHPKRFMLQLTWPDTYPDFAPEINLDIFYNSHLLPNLKRRMTVRFAEEAALWLGSAMTYTLFEFAKENVHSLILDEDLVHNLRSEEVQERKVAAPVTYLYEEGRGEDTSAKPRGWNWVDCVKHLSQTGGQADKV